MSSKNTINKDRENFMLAGKLSELEWTPRTEQQIRTDLFKGSDPEKMVDAFEKQVGIDIPEPVKVNEVYKNVALSPMEDDEDAGLLCKFYNNPEQYRVINRSDFWTSTGKLKIFLEYFENIDLRQEKEAK